MRWYLMVMSKYDEFRGRSGKKELWTFVIYNLVFVGIAIAIDNMAGTTAAGLPYGLFNYLYIMAIIIPGWALTIRRLHDIGKSGWFSLIILIPVIGIIWLLALFFADGDVGGNKYGTNPEIIAHS